MFYIQVNAFFDHDSIDRNSELPSVSDKHIIVSAPTGSGKTTILELAIVQLLIYLESISYKIDEDGKNIKIVYGEYQMEFRMIRNIVYSHFSRVSGTNQSSLQRNLHQMDAKVHMHQFEVCAGYWEYRCGLCGFERCD